MRSNRFGFAMLPALAGVVAGIAIASGFFYLQGYHVAFVKVQPHVHDAVTTHGEWVKFANAKGDSVRAYIAYPERAGKAPAIIIIHEIFGLTPWEPTVADDFAGKGYIAIVPDLLSSRFGISPATEDSGRKLVALLAPDGVVADLDAAYKYISAQPATNVDRIGIIGFCWGGGNVWRYAAANTKLKAAVACYGPVADTAMLRKIQTPVLGVYGQNDGRVTASIPDIVRILGSTRTPFAVDSYLGTGHGFLKPGRTGNGTPEAARAQKNIDAFFAKYLDGK
jgi:carboxymethylenebutenolidase